MESKGGVSLDGVPPFGGRRGASAVGFRRATMRELTGSRVLKFDYEISKWWGTILRLILRNRYRQDLAIELFVPGKDLLIGFAIDRAPACDLHHFHARQPMPRMVGVERIR
jgi:hypothetical protein